MAFQVNSQIENGVATINLIGELDAGVAGDFRIAVDQVAAQKPRRLVLHMDQLSFMASAGLRVLVFAKQKLGSDVDIYIVGTHDAVRDTIEMTGFHQSVFMVDSYDADSSA